MYLLDTDTIIYALKGHSEVVGHFQEKAARPKALSVITYGELLFGAMKSARRQENAARVRRVSELFPVIPVGQAVMESFASLKREMEAKGKRVDDFDLVIASTALMLGYRLVANNERHFQAIPGLAIENWTKPTA
jgi:tRNA(fMet)-specific endonuclease VapC